MTAADNQLKAAIATTRFGLGARPGEIAAAAQDPEGWLRAQITPNGADLPQGNGETSAQRIRDFREFQQDRKAERRQDGGVQAPTRDAARQDPPQPEERRQGQGRDPAMLARRMLRDDTGTDFLARVRLGAATDASFRERWALFWANHFTVSANKLATATLIGPFEVEAIRPRVFGRFEDLLVASSTHPAMLLYLDQAQSIGPDSRAAQFLDRRAGGQRKVGLNENLAREIMELHTVGVDAGYTQADVTEFARAMTGFSIGGLRERDGRAGEAMFRPQAHEPGARTVMGKTYRQEGEAQPRAILADLARKPQTARFVCGKIARHFVADDPPPALVNRLVDAWTRSDGRLDKVAEALVAAPEAWAPNQAKFKTPYEFVVSGWRATGDAPDDIRPLAATLTTLGQKPFAPPSPKGWPDKTADWAAPDAIVKRMQYAQGFAAREIQGGDPKALAQATLGAQLSPATATAVARAESRNEAFALLLMSPEFLRR